MSKTVKIAVVLVLGGGLIFASAACTEEAESYSHDPFHESMRLGGEEVSAATLNAGWEAYVLNCRQCHGDKGDGTGPSSKGLRPPPRDFTKAMFKFGGVAAGDLPHDEDLRRVVKGGLHGTAMLSWDVEDHELDDILQYIKTFSERWKTEEPGERIMPTKDPYGEDRREEAVKLGASLYHIKAQCGGCHPNYATKQQLNDFSVAAGRGIVTDFRRNLYGSEPRDSDYRLNGKVLKILPPDFLSYRARTVPEGPDVTERQVLDALYVTVASGIGGTPMPVWKGGLPEDELWAVVYYVKSLIDIRDTEAGEALRDRLEHQPRYVPPTPPPPPEPPTVEGSAAPGGVTAPASAGPASAAPTSAAPVSARPAGSAAPASARPAGTARPPATAAPAASAAPAPTKAPGTAAP
jgi:mono/diheme cytochrome c family protein